MFESLSERFDGIFSRLSKRGRITDRDVDEVAGELRRALLAAYVNARVARAFVDRVKERAVGADVHKALNPAQQVLKIVNEAAVVTQEFNDRIGLDGLIITKVDGDARGGGVLWLKEVSGKPILFAG